MSEARELPEDLTYDDWASALEEGRLLGQKCPDCGHGGGAPTGACPHCGSRDLRTVELPREGEVYSETTIAVPPASFGEEPYQVAIVQVGDARVMGRLEDRTDIGRPVELAGFVDTDDGHPAPVFEPAG